jgi:uncharacterized protein YaiE (UPF0345 family)
MKKLIAVITLASAMGVAYAEEPVALTDSQMDNVSAGGFAFSSSAAAALGVIAAATATENESFVEVLDVIPIQGGQIVVDQATSWSYSAAAAL